MDELKEKLASLQSAKAEIDTACAPLVTRRESLWEELHPIKAQIEELSDEEKRIKTEGGYWELSEKIGEISDLIMSVKKAL